MQGGCTPRDSEGLQLRLGGLLRLRRLGIRRAFERSASDLRGKQLARPPRGLPGPSTHQIQQTLEELDEPLTGQSDGGDNGQRDKPGDEAVFNGSGAGLVTQKFPKHSFSLSRFRRGRLWHVQIAGEIIKILKLQTFFALRPA